MRSPPLAPGAPLAVRWPGHLGDGVLALPLLEALGRRHPLALEGPAWSAALGAHLPRATGPADAILLLKPSFSAAWRARRHRVRVGLATDARWPLLTHAVVPGGGHLLADHRALGAVFGVLASGAPCVRATAPAPPLPARAVLVLPCSGAGGARDHGAWAALGPALAARGWAPVYAAGPGQDAALAAAAGPFPRLPPLSIPAFAAVARAAERVVGNDAGLTHLAAAARRAAGWADATVHVSYGPTAPGASGPPGATAHHGERPACWPCAQTRCRFTGPPPCAHPGLPVDPAALGAPADGGGGGG